MKNPIIRIICFCMAILAVSNAYADFFYKDGFSYYGNPFDYTATVTDVPCTKIVEIPSKVVYEGTTYTVTKANFTFPREPYECYSGAYYSKISTLKIPSTIKNFNLIGTFHHYGGPSDSQHFLGEWFQSLSKIIVDEDNAVYKSQNGTLYTKDGKILLMCPQKNMSSEILSTTEEIGENAFYYSKLTNIELPSSIKTINTRAFFGSSLNTINIPNGITEIADATFAFSDLKTIMLPNALESIGYCAFQCCKLTQIEFPETLKSIGELAFEYNNFRTIKFPKSLNSVSQLAFRECSLIESIYCQWETPIYTPTIFPDNVISTATLYVPMGCKSIYENNLPWRNFWNIKEFDYSGIEDIFIDDKQEEGIIYDLRGINHKTPVKGSIYILNGKKYVGR